MSIFLRIYGARPSHLSVLRWVPKFTQAGYLVRTEFQARSDDVNTEVLVVSDTIISSARIFSMLQGFLSSLKMHYTLPNVESSYYISNIKIAAFLAFTKADPIPIVPMDKVLLQFRRQVGKQSMTEVKQNIEAAMMTIIRFIKRLPLENDDCQLTYIQSLREFHTVMSCDYAQCSTYNFIHNELCNHV